MVDVSTKEFILSASVELDIAVLSLELLISSVQECGFALKDLRQAQAELKNFEDCDGRSSEIDAMMTTDTGERFGVQQRADGTYHFLAQRELTPAGRKSLNRVSQAYARLRILDEVKQKGYKSVKEERLANGSIRIVVEKWR